MRGLDEIGGLRNRRLNHCHKVSFSGSLVPSGCSESGWLGRGGNGSSPGLSSWTVGDVSLGSAPA